jgi:3-oxoacyl-[acyl-carrier protein] reductase
MGRAIAELFSAEGAKVLVNFRASQKEAEDVVRAIESQGGEALAWQADVAVDAEVRAMMKAVEERWGRLDVLVNNAGWSKVTPHHQLEDLNDEIWDRTLNANLRGAFYASRAAVPLIRKSGGGSIINNTSASAWHAAGSSIVYSASKAALVNMTKSLARALAPDIRVNAVAPGLVRTRFAGWPASTFEQGLRMAPLGRLTTAEEVAAVVLFLATDATAITAETILVDGGRTQLGPRLS